MVSEKQLEYARFLAQKEGITLPEVCKTDYKLCSDFIKKYEPRISEAQKKMINIIIDSGVILDIEDINLLSRTEASGIIKENYAVLSKKEKKISEKQKNIIKILIEKGSPFVDVENLSGKEAFDYISINKEKYLNSDKETNKISLKFLKYVELMSERLDLKHTIKNWEDYNELKEFADRHKQEYEIKFPYKKQE